jgi:hypothetical protein
MPLSAPVLPIGNYGMNAGSSARDLITGVGAQVVLAGQGDDILGAQNVAGADGQTPLFPWLVGGAENDRYYATPGNTAIISDLEGGKDTVFLDAFKFKAVQIRRVDNRHALISQGSTQVLLVDPAGRSEANNLLETIVFKDTKVSGKKLFKAAQENDSYWGKTTLLEQVSLGTLPMRAGGLDPALFNGYLTSASYNNSLVV